VSRTCVEIVGAVGAVDFGNEGSSGGSGVPGSMLATYPPGIAHLRITVGDGPSL
jgi:hypothetical protein